MLTKLFKAAPAVIIIAALALMLFIGRNFLDEKLPVIGQNYYKDFKSSAELEYKYSQKGPHAVKDYTMESGSDKVGEIGVWYPGDMQGEKAPMILVVNPSKIAQHKYKAFFERLASWGFVVVGNEDPQTGNGESASLTLDAMMNLVDTHPLREVIDYDSIGIIGYSQGGAGALAAATEYENGSAYKAIFAGSPVCPEVGKDYGWTYDLSKITVPCFMAAGTGDSDSGNDAEDVTGVAPLTFLMDSYDLMDESVDKITGRIVGAEHADTLLRSDGYMTAWMLYQLAGDQEAAKAFAGNSAEILSNENWQDVQKNN